VFVVVADLQTWGSTLAHRSLMFWWCGNVASSVKPNFFRYLFL